MSIKILRPLDQKSMLIWLSGRFRGSLSASEHWVRTSREPGALGRLAAVGLVLRSIPVPQLQDLVLSGIKVEWLKSPFSFDYNY